MASTNPQKSEVHEATADASTSPTAAGDAQATRRQPSPAPPAGPKRDLPGLDERTRITRDDTDSGGPLVIETSDPDLEHPDVPVDPFPTERTPAIDPPIERP